MQIFGLKGTFSGGRRKKKTSAPSIERGAKLNTTRRFYTFKKKSEYAA